MRTPLLADDHAGGRSSSTTIPVRLHGRADGIPGSSEVGGSRGKRGDEREECGGSLQSGDGERVLRSINIHTGGVMHKHRR